MDFRKLNAITRFDTEPITNINNIKLAEDILFMKIDLTKSNWHSWKIGNPNVKASFNKGVTNLLTGRFLPFNKNSTDKKMSFGMKSL